MWLHLCGTDATEAVECYWELFVDVALVFALTSIQHALEKRQDYSGFFEFSLLYFSIINGWYLYTHHFASRFPESSRLHSFLVVVFLLGMISGICNASYDHAQAFSLSMIVQRVAVFMMTARIAIQVPRAGAMCALLGFITTDAILCFALAASDASVAPYLWFFAAVLEVHGDLLLALSLQGSLVVPCNVKLSMDRAWALILAPLGATLVSVMIRPASSSMDQDGIQIVSSITLLVLFGCLYFDLQSDSVDHVVASRSPFHQALLLLLIKFLGWAMWTVGACIFMDLDTTHPSSDDPSSISSRSAALTTSTIKYRHSMVGWSVGSAIILFFCLRLFGGRPHDRLEVYWSICCWIPFVVVTVIPPRCHSISMTIYMILISSLNMAESCTHLVDPTTINDENNNGNGQDHPDDDDDADADDETQHLLPFSSSTSTSSSSTTITTTTLVQSYTQSSA